jgi:nucleoid-associated protein YgaU
MKPVRFALSPLALVMATVIAGCSSQPPVPVVERGRGGASIPAATTIATTDAPVAPAEAPPGFYIVKKGDNLLRISLDHGQY